MKIDFYSRLRNIAGCSSTSYPIVGSISLLDLLRQLVKKYPAFQVIFFDQQGNLYDQVPVFLNGRNPRLFPEGLNTRVVEADVLSLFTPISSGKMNVEVLQRAELAGTVQESSHET